MDPIEFAKLFNDLLPKNIKVDFEYRLYYNKETGEPLFYSMEQPSGDYIVVTKQQYTEGRHDLVIRNGVIEQLVDAVSWSKLVPSDSGTGCNPNNVMIVDDSSNVKWKIKTYYTD